MTSFNPAVNTQANFIPNMNTQTKPATATSQAAPSKAGGTASAPPTVAAVESVETDDDGSGGGNEASGWWSPNIFPQEVPGYTEGAGNLSYGGESFQMQ